MACTDLSRLFCIDLHMNSWKGPLDCLLHLPRTHFKAATVLHTHNKRGVSAYETDTVVYQDTQLLLIGLAGLSSNTTVVS